MAGRLIVDTSSFWLPRPRWPSQGGYELSGQHSALSSNARERVVQCDSTLLFVSAQGTSQRRTMQLLSHILGGHDRSSLLIGLVLGGFFIFVVMNAYEWFQNTRDLVIGRTATARKKVKQKKDEIQNIEQEARDLRRDWVQHRRWESGVLYCSGLGHCLVHNQSLANGHSVRPRIRRLFHLPAFLKSGTWRRRHRRRLPQRQP